MKQGTVITELFSEANNKRAVISTSPSTNDFAVDFLEEDVIIGTDWRATEKEAYDAAEDWVYTD